MVGVSDNMVGLQPSRGFIGTQRILSGHQGANAALTLFGRGKYLLGGWCGPQSAVDVWQVEPFRSLQNITLEMQLADMAAGAEQPLVIPPGVSADRSDWAPHLVPVMDAAVCSTGTRILVAGGRGVRILELDGQQVQWRRRDVFRGHGAALTACALNTDGEIGASADQSGTVLVWGTESAREFHRLKITTVPQCVSFIWQDHLVAVGDDRGRIICWEVAQGRRHLQFQAHRGAVTSMQFDASTGCLVTSGSDGCARIWNLERGQQVGADLKHRGSVHSAIIVNEGRFVLTGGADGHVAAWSTHDGLLLDWHNDGSPVFGISAEDATGTVVLAGARSVKTLNVDFIRLRELALSASRASQARSTQHAPGYVAPPVAAAVNYAGGAFQAPVGSVMAARQTSDLPMPEQSSARVDRSHMAGIRAATGQVPAIDSLRASPRQAPLQPSAPPSTQAMGAIGAPPAPVSPPAAAHTGGIFGGNTNAGISPGAWGGQPSAAPLNGMQPGPGISPFAGGSASMAPSQSFADGFFDGAEVVPPAVNAPPVQIPVPAPPAQQAQYIPGRSAPASPPATAAWRPVEGPIRQPLSEDSAVVAAGPYSGRTIDESILEGAPKPKPPEKPAPPPFPVAAAGIVLVMALLSGFGVQVASNNYYSTIGVPDGLEGRPTEIESSYNGAVASAEAAFNSLRVQQEALMAQESANPALQPSEVERLHRRHQRQIEDARQVMSEAQIQAARERDDRMGSLQPEREELAFEMSIRHGGYAGAGVLLLGLLVIQLLEKRKAALAPSPRRAR